jgi:chromosome partitioning protein
MAAVVAVVNQKGGVGKTTTAVNLSAGLALAGKRVVLVDLDPQGNATTGLGIGKEGLYPTAYHVLLGGEPIGKALHTTETQGLSLVPSDIDLVGAEIELVGVDRREFVLRGVLGSLRTEFDFIIIDCPPSLGLLTLNALTASDKVLIPLQCEFYALEGLSHLIKTVARVRERLNPTLEVFGILLTMFDGRTSLALQIRDEVNRYFPGQIFDTVIPRSVRVTEAPSHGKPVMLYDLRSSGSVAYLDLAREVLTHGS